MCIDGNTLPSNAEWALASGCAPVLLSRWTYYMTDVAEPWVHYIPLDFDLELPHLAETIYEACTLKGEEIAYNAQEHARIVLSQEFLKQYTVRQFEEAYERHFSHSS
jgi:hypothetical protein